jgi:Zn-finger protein
MNIITILKKLENGEKLYRTEKGLYFVNHETNKKERFHYDTLYNIREFLECHRITDDIIRIDICHKTTAIKKKYSREAVLKHLRSLHDREARKFVKFMISKKWVLEEKQRSYYEMARNCR